MPLPELDRPGAPPAKAARLGVERSGREAQFRAAAGGVVGGFQWSGCQLAGEAWRPGAGALAGAQGQLRSGWPVCPRRAGTQVTCGVGTWRMHGWHRASTSCNKHKRLLGNPLAIWASRHAPFRPALPVRRHGTPYQTRGDAAVLVAHPVSTVQQPKRHHTHPPYRRVSAQAPLPGCFSGGRGAQRGREGGPGALQAPPRSSAPVLRIASSRRRRAPACPVGMLQEPGPQAQGETFNQVVG